MKTKRTCLVRGILSFIFSLTFSKECLQENRGGEAHIDNSGKRYTFQVLYTLYRVFIPSLYEFAVGQAVGYKCSFLFIFPLSCLLTNSLTIIRNICEQREECSKKLVAESIFFRTEREKTLVRRRLDVNRRDDLC